MARTRSVVINGDLGSGKSTASTLLAEQLGVRRISIGDLYRGMAMQRGMTALEFNLHAELDDKVDQRRLAERSDSERARFTGLEYTRPHFLAVNVVAQIFAVVTGLVHVWAFVMESLLFRTGHKLFRVPAEDVPKVRLWAFNQGFYNLFFAAGAIGGVIALHTGHTTVGRTLVLFTCASMFLAGVVLFESDPRKQRLSGALGQGVPPLIVLLTSLV